MIALQLIDNMGCTRVQCSSGYYSLTIKEGLDGAECLRADGSTGVCLGKYCAVSLHIYKL